MASIKFGKWKFNSNGFAGSLVIDFVDANNNIQGRIIEGSRTDSISGFWDENSRKINFIRVVDKNNPSSFQIYTGYLMSNNTTIAGSFEAFQGTGATANQSVFGWFATFP